MSPLVSSINPKAVTLMCLLFLLSVDLAKHPGDVAFTPCRDEHFSARQPGRSEKGTRDVQRGDDRPNRMCRPVALT